MKTIDEIWSRMIELANPEKLPDSFFLNCQNIWEAFDLGEEYANAKKAGMQRSGCANAQEEEPK